MVPLVYPMKVYDFQGEFRLRDVDRDYSPRIFVNEAPSLSAMSL